MYKRQAQVRPYVKYAAQDRELRVIIEGVIAKQAEFVCLDPYANAFNERADGSGHKDETENNDHVWERKYEMCIRDRLRTRMHPGSSSNGGQCSLKTVWNSAKSAETFLPTKKLQRILILWMMIY